MINLLQIAETKWRVEDRSGKSKQHKSPKRDEFQGDKLIREAEVKRARNYRNPGNLANFNERQLQGVFSTVDDEYLVVGGHIDGNLHQKIVDFEYIDFSRLLPRDKLARTEDHRYEFVVRGGSTFFAPISDRDATTISSFSKWEQAFRIYSNILTRSYPGKASELIQYNHIIYTASLSFVWDNVYHYDKEFRMHVSKFPQRSWSIILQQAWSMCLKDKLSEENRSQSVKSNGSKMSKEPCRRFNKGKCNYGPQCKFDHRCAIKKCGKFGHGAHVCRLRNETSSGASSHGNGGSAPSTSN